MANIQWFPGHMNKARIQIEQHVKLVDVVIELRDARIPKSSFNPLLDVLIKHKKRLIVLNKKDLADPTVTKQWLEYYQKLNLNILALNCNKDKVNQIISDKVKELCEDILEKAKRRGILKKTLKVMVVGIPNVGKSTFINKMVLKSVAKTENRPGVTKNVNWIRIHKDIDLLDTPGVLSPSFEDDIIGYNLAVIGSINDKIIDKQDLSKYILEYLIKYYPDNLFKRYQIKDYDSLNDIYTQIGINKTLYTTNQNIDYERVYDFIISDIRNNKLGNLSFERV